MDRDHAESTVTVCWEQGDDLRYAGFAYPAEVGAHRVGRGAPGGAGRRYLLVRHLGAELRNQPEHDALMLRQHGSETRRIDARDSVEVSESLIDDAT